MPTIRRASAEDAVDICRVHVSSIREVCAADYTPEQINTWAGGKTPEGYVRAMQAGEQMFVALLADEVVGFGSIDLTKSTIQAVYVHPTALGKGAGKALLLALEETAKKANIEELNLPSSLTARGFYEKNGYIAGEQTVHTLSSGVDLECIPMKKSMNI
jgi:putative acetyltransferase